MFVRDRAAKRELKLLNALLMVKTTLWKTLFGKEADKLEHANDDERTYYIIEKEPLVNTFISVPKDKGSLNCAAFVAGIVEAVLEGANFPAKVINIESCHDVVFKLWLLGNCTLAQRYNLHGQI